jgi:hypothetical protein
MSTTSGDVCQFPASGGDTDDDAAFIEDTSEKKRSKKSKEPDTDSDEDLPLARVREKKVRC